MERDVIKKANEIIKDIEIKEKEIEYLKDYVAKGVTVYFKREPDYGCGLKFSDPLMLGVREVLDLIDRRRNSIDELERKLAEL